MEVVPVSKVLEEHLKRLTAPNLSALQADDSLYTLLCLQPAGRLRITDDSIGHSDAAASAEQVRDFFRLALDLKAKPDLVICPEYSVPWEVLLQLLEGGASPERGKLWVLGCESLPLQHLKVYRERLGERLIIIDEGEGAQPVTTQRYRNPLVYLFRASSEVDGAEHLVMLVQYKTVVSGDGSNTEARGMLPGTVVYMFGTPPTQVRLMTLICSDVFGLQDKDVVPYYDGLLLLHIQLNNNPRHALYKPYRTKLFGYGGRTELVCLNWAADVVVVDAHGGNVAEWHNIGGSAWYSHSPQVDFSDAKVSENHAHGLYYTRSRAAHVLQLHYAPRAFLIEATKVFHHGVIAARTHLTGPRALGTYYWDEGEKRWQLADEKAKQPADGFSQMLARVSHGTCDMTDLENVYAAGPVDVERTLAISSGEFGPKPEWYEATNIDSMQLCEQEIVRRLTVTLDPEAADFRSRRMSSARVLCELRASNFSWPREVEFLKDGFSLTWSKAVPNRNVMARNGRYATVIYVGQVGDPKLVEKIDQRARQTLVGHVPEPEHLLSEDEEREHRRSHFAQVPRLCVLYGTAVGTTVYSNPVSTAIASPAGANAVDISIPSQRRRTGEGEQA
ncbi:MAG: hypothetical protein M3Y55_11620 [Pseudomonadota bacterium]|nr:hypothetical protein [Pseudomonadota bacterium]